MVKHLMAGQETVHKRMMRHVIIHAMMNYEKWNRKF
jgi:hypothetical protein